MEKGEVGLRLAGDQSKQSNIYRSLNKDKFLGI